MNTTLSNDFNCNQDDDPKGAKRVILLVVVFPLLIILTFFVLLGLGWLILFLYKNIAMSFLLFGNFLISVLISYYFIKRTIADNEDGLQEDDEE